VTDQDVVFIRKFIEQNSNDSRWMLSRKLCQAWNWVQPNGALRDMICRGMMLELARAGQIELPPVRTRIVNPLVCRERPARIEIDQTPLTGKVSGLGPLEFRQVRRTASESLFNSVIEHHHYLGYCQPVGEQLKYMVFLKDKPLACLASHILGKMVKILPGDWERLYRHPLYYLETFVDRDRFAGTCYRAANWIHVGRTTGRGKNDQTGKANRSIKDVLGYPLTRDFRARLCGGRR